MTCWAEFKKGARGNSNKVAALANAQSFLTKYRHGVITTRQNLHEMNGRHSVLKKSRQNENHLQKKQCGFVTNLLVQNFEQTRSSSRRLDISLCWKFKFFYAVTVLDPLYTYKRVVCRRLFRTYKLCVGYKDQNFDSSRPSLRQTSTLSATTRHKRDYSCTNECLL